MVDTSNPLSLARHLDLTAAEAHFTTADIERACAQAKTLQAAALCVPGVWVTLARSRLEESAVKVCALISFPHGLMTADVKRYEIEAALDEGAQEFEVMAHHALLREKEPKAFLRELRDLVEAAEEHPLKVCVRPELLASEDILRVANWCVEAEAQCLCLAPEVLGTWNVVEEVRRLNAVFSGSLFLKVALPTPQRGLVNDLLAAGVMRVGVKFDPAGL
ncbi:hypothetical protein NXS98_05590 [Fontisphaera persica]|uniref:hypothetical protein n=1 Tax=Fontisphaera persica TaxID=2974023 RepID=UPI0024C06B8F|nr:hypothetical protein [Fontisphaera persica]WCJ60602.1 hypothetical protein NXS98_05590 [Fontisphaera persica]